MADLRAQMAGTGGSGTMMTGNDMPDDMPTVTCLRCGATYPEGAVVCFRCGAPIGEVSSATQPVRPFQAIPPTPPASPEPPPPVLQLIEQDRVPTRPRVAVVAKKRPLTPAERWERRGRVVLIVFVLLVLGAATTGVVVGVRALLAGSPVPHQTIYQDPQHRFRFMRPALWTVTPSSDGVLLTDSEGTSTLRVTVATPAAGESAQSRADAIANDQDLATDTPETFAGVDWQARVGNVTGRDGVVREVEVYVAEHNGLLYIVQLASPIASFDGVNNLVYQQLLASFTFA